MNNNIVLKSDTPDVSYNFPDSSFNYEQIEYGNNTDFNYNVLYKYADHQITIDTSNSIPFSLVLLENNFKILTKFYKFCSEYIPQNIEEFGFTDLKLILINKIFKTCFVFHRDSKEYITLSVKPHILNNFLFIGKYRELLEVIFSSDTSDIFYNTKILEIFGTKENFINFYDMNNGYNKITNSSKSINTSLTGLSKYISENKNNFNTYFRTFKNEITELKNFNEILNEIDARNTVNGTTPMRTKLSYLFYATFLGLRLKKPTLSFKGNNKFYPINIRATVQNVLNDTFQEPDQIVTESINNKLFESNNNFPNMESYSSSKYTFDGQSYIFPDCVENTIYQLLKALTWTGDNYNINYLPETTIPQVKNIFTKLTSDSNLKEEFVNVITNISTLSDVYKKDISGVKYEIASTIPNFAKVLNYIFKIDILESIEDLKINPDIKNIIFEGETIEVDFGEKGKFLATIKPGHATHMIVNDILDYFIGFEYINIIIIFSQLYPLFSILRFNILTRFIQINKNDHPILEGINEIILIENDYCNITFRLKEIELDKVDLKKKIETNRSKRSKHDKDTDEYNKYNKKVQKYKKIKKKVLQLMSKKSSVKRKRNVKIQKILDSFNTSLPIIPLSKFLLLDSNLYNIDSPNNCLLFYDLDESIFNNNKIYHNILQRFNLKDREEILVNSNYLVNNYERSEKRDYISLLNILEPSFFSKKIIKIQKEGTELYINMLRFILLSSYDSYYEEYFYLVLKSIIDRLSIEIIESFKAENYDNKTGQDIVLSKIEKVKSRVLKTYLYEKFRI